MQYALSTISWFAPRARDTSCDPYLTLAIEYDASNAKVAVPDVCAFFYLRKNNDLLGFLFLG